MTIEKDKRIEFLKNELKKVDEEKFALTHRKAELLQTASIEELRESDEILEEQISEIRNQIGKIDRIQREQCNSEALQVRKEKKVKNKIMYLEKRENKKINLMKNSIKKIYELFEMTKNE